MTIPTPTRPAKKAPVSRPAIKASSNPFDDLIDTRTTQGKFLMLYGEAGEGKTSLAAQFPAPLFVVTSGEQGIFLLKQRSVVSQNLPVIALDELFPHEFIPQGTGHPGWKKCMETLEMFRDDDHPYQTLVIDSVSGLQDLCFQHCASQLFDGDMDSEAFTGWFRGYSKAAEAFWSAEFLPIILSIVARGLNVVLVAHQDYKQVENPSGPDFNRFQPALQKGIWNFTKKDLHGVFYLGREVMVVIDKKTKKKSTTGDRRFIGLAPSTYYIAKTWCTPEGITELECGESAAASWSVLKEALGM